MATHEDLERLAREAGKAGVRYSDWSCCDAVFELVSALDEAGIRFDTRKFEAAHGEGRREFKLSGGWRSLWTTAPSDYDLFGTETVEDGGEWKGKRLRRVIVDPAHVDYQEGRYSSGLHGSWPEDPRVEEARWAEERARRKAEDEEREARRKAGLEWLASVDDSLVEGDEDAFDEELRAHGLRWEDGRAEHRHRAAAKKDAERAVTWARCRAAFADGATLVDPGSPSTRGYFGVIPGREPRVWHRVAVRQSYQRADDAQLAEVYDGETTVLIGALVDVADQIAKGELRAAGEGEHLPPGAVVARLGIPFTEIVRAEVGGVAVWVGCQRFGFDLLVLDDAGKLVRKKAVREAAEWIYREKRFGA